MDLNYLMTSDFDNDLSVDNYKALLLKFRYEYRLLIGKNSSFEKEIEKLKLEIENLNGLLYEEGLKNTTKRVALENELHQMQAKVKRSLSLKERLSGKING